MKYTTSNSVTRRTFLASSAAAVAAVSAGASVQRSTDRIRVGLIGPGQHGSALIHAMETLGPLHNASVVSVHRDSLDALSPERIDAVIIATPDHLHAEMSVAAMEAGLHVYCAPPMARTEAEAAIVRDAAVASDRVYRVGVDLLLEPRWRAARALVQSGIIGDVRWCSGTAYSNPDDQEWQSGWRTAPMCTLGAAAHHLHELWATCAFVTGAQVPVAVSVMGGSFETEETLPDALSLSADFNDGLHFNLDCHPSRYSTPHAVVRGSAGSLIIERECIAAMPESIGGADVREVWRDSGQPTVTALEDWLACIRSGRSDRFETDLGYEASTGIARAMDVYRSQNAA